MVKLAAQTFHDIAPPVDYSLVSPAMVFLGSLLALLVLGGLFFLARKWFRRPSTVLSPRDRALAALRSAEPAVTSVPPYEFSIRVSDILRRFVLEQYQLPMTRQTSVEFLNAINSSGHFGENERALLADFLERCDLIKFARYEASAEESRCLLDEARHFVEGGALVRA